MDSTAAALTTTAYVAHTVHTSFEAARSDASANTTNFNHMFGDACVNCARAAVRVANQLKSAYLQLLCVCVCRLASLSQELLLASQEMAPK